MSFDRIFTIATALIGVALVTTIVAHPGSRDVINASGSAFTGAIRAAQGR